MMAMILVAAIALTLPADFDKAANLRFKERADGRLHMSSESAGFATNLVANGTPEDIELAVKIFDAVIACQETREGNRNYGNFWWYLEDGKVTDRNAAAFILSSLIPMMIERADRLPEATQEKILKAIRLGLEAVARINVTVGYTTQKRHLVEKKSCG